jgi:hypothetical protein
MSWDSLVGVVTGYGFDDLGSIHGRVRGFFLHSVQTGSEAHPVSSPMDTRKLFL